MANRRAARASIIGAALLAVVVLGQFSPASAATRSAPTPSARGRRPLFSSAGSPLARSDSVLSRRLSQLSEPELLSASSARRSAAVGLAPTGTGSLLQRGDRYVVDIRVVDTSLATRQALARAGADIITVDTLTGVITAAVAPQVLQSVARVDGVQYIHEELAPIVGTAQPGVASGRTSPDPALGGAAAGPVCNPVVSEGVSVVGADAARATYGADGASVKVGILSDSFDNRHGAAAGVAADELPGLANPCGHTNPVQVLEDLPYLNGVAEGIDEGRTMAEVVHDVAPGAQLAFATASAGKAEFALNIRRLAASGAKLIVDDVQYVDELMYQDGDIAKAINDVADQGVGYFSAAGDQNVIDDQGNGVGSYEAAGGYRPVPCQHDLLYVDPEYGPVHSDELYADCHNFDPVGVTRSNRITVAANATVGIALGWSEPQWRVPTDYDIWVIDDATGQAVAGSADSQDQTYTPNEFLGWQNPSSSPHNYRIVVGRYRNDLHPWGDEPRFRLVMYTGVHSIKAMQFAPPGGPGVPHAPTLSGHSAAAGAFTVGAIGFDALPYPEDSSSRGPTEHCWAPVTGTLAPAEFWPACPGFWVDMAAPDGGRTSDYDDTPPPHRFFGTGAAASHAVGVAALGLSHYPCWVGGQAAGAVAYTLHPLGGGLGEAEGQGLVAADGLFHGWGQCDISPGSAYHPVNPTRVLESRNLPGNVGGFHTPWGPGETRVVKVTNTNNSGVPDSSVSAVVLNVTVTDTTAASFLSVFPAWQQRSSSSNLNWTAGTTIANLVTVKVPSSGEVAFYNALGSANVIADVVGYYDGDGVDPGGQLYNPTAPTRILESRPNAGNIGGFTTPWTAGMTRTLDVTGSTTGVVPADARAVVLNVTVTDTTTPGFLTVFPADVPTVPTASNINWSAHKTIPNLVTVRLGTGSSDALGKIKVYNAVGSTNVIVDVVGYYADTGWQFHALAPPRVLDSRYGNGDILGAWGAGQTRGLDVTATGLSGVPASGAQAVVMNVTVTDTGTAGFLTIFPANTATVPNASNLNWSAHDTIPNLTITRVGLSGNDGVKIFNAVGSSQVIADVVGWFG